jgi:nickel-dependent lactate racemase
MIVTFPYGKQEIQIELKDSNRVDIFSPKDAAPAPDQLAAVRTALESPEAVQILEQHRGCSSVAIAINDKTRPVPHQYLLPPLLQALADRDILRQNIHFIIATGSHAPMPPSEFSKILPEDIFRQYSVTSHDFNDQENLVFLGLTGRGTPIWINRQFYEAELKIVVGNIEPHHFAGFSGGVKTAVIGLGGPQTVYKNHSMLVHPDSFIGKFDRNPLRQDIEELGRYVQIHLALNAVLNADKAIVHVLAGDPAQVMQTGIPFSRQICQVTASQRYDIVFSSPGGYPKDINLYQSQKALTHGAILCKDGGTVILVAACPEGSGSRLYEQFMADVHTVDQVFEKFSRQEFKVGPHKAFQFAREMKRINVILVSDLPAELVRTLLLTPARKLEEAFEMARAISGKDQPDIACLPRATNTIPFIPESIDQIGL